MMKTLNFAKRNIKEIIRDPLSIIFAVILPLFLLVIFQQFKIPNDAYKIENFTPGIIIFGLSFISMFTAVLVAKDRSTSLLTRLAISPMKSHEYVLGYILAVLPVILIQNLLFFAAAVILGLDFGVNVILTMLISLPISILFIALGILIGSITTEKSASGVASVVVQLVAFTSGMYFTADMVGKGFAAVCNALPFSACLNILKFTLNGGDEIWRSVIIAVAYTIAVLILAVFIFNRKMTGKK